MRLNDAPAYPAGISTIDLPSIASATLSLTMARPPLPRSASLRLAIAFALAVRSVRIASAFCC